MYLSHSPEDPFYFEVGSWSVIFCSQFLHNLTIMPNIYTYSKTTWGLIWLCDFWSGGWHLLLKHQSKSHAGGLKKMTWQLIFLLDVRDILIYYIPREQAAIHGVLIYRLPLFQNIKHSIYNDWDKMFFLGFLSNRKLASIKLLALAMWKILLNIRATVENKAIQRKLYCKVMIFETKVV